MDNLDKANRHKRQKKDIPDEYNLDKEEEDDDSSSDITADYSKEVDDIELLDNFLEYLIRTQKWSDKTSKKHFKNMEQVYSIRSYLGMSNLTDIIDNYDKISSHKLAMQYKTSIDYFKMFLEQKSTSFAIPKNNITCSITFNKVPFKEGMKIFFSTN